MGMKKKGKAKGKEMPEAGALSDPREGLYIKIVLYSLSTAYRIVLCNADWLMELFFLN